MKISTNRIFPEPKKASQKSIALREEFSVGQDFLVGVSLIAWAFILIQSMLLSLEGAASIAGQNYGPGMAVFEYISKYTLKIFDSTYSTLSICVSGLTTWGVSEFFNAFLMWQVMMTAMMVPTLLVPNKLAMSKTKNGRAYPLLIVAQTTFGYLIAWAFFCVCAVLLQWLLQSNAILNAGMRIENSILSGSILLGAGLFQFNNITDRNKVSVEVSHINFLHQLEKQPGLKVGLNFGLKCVLVNWPIMCTMFVFGLMNIVMMAVLTGMMILQKLESNSLIFSKLITVFLIGFGLVYLVA